MRNVVPARALARRSRRLLEVAFIAITGGIFFAVVGLALRIVPLVHEASRLYPAFNAGRWCLILGGILLTGAGGVLILRALTWKTENDLAKQTGDFLSEHLDEQYTFIRNISRYKLGYIDAALVGPAGVMIFRIVDYKGAFLNEAGKWMKADLKSEKWKTASINPTKEVVQDIKSLRAYLAARKLPDMPVFGMIVFVKDDPAVHLTLKDSVVRATHLSSLPHRLQEDYLTKERLEPPAVKKIVRLLYGD